MENEFNITIDKLKKSIFIYFTINTLFTIQIFKSQNYFESFNLSSQFYNRN